MGTVAVGRMRLPVVKWYVKRTRDGPRAYLAFDLRRVWGLAGRETPCKRILGHPRAPLQSSRGERVTDCPTPFYPLVNSLVRLPGPDRSLPQGMLIEVLAAALLSIIGLFLPSRPGAVLRRVAFGIVLALQGHAGRRLAHVPAEVLKPLVAMRNTLKFKPTLANCDVFSVIKLIGWVRFLITPRLHALPL